MRRRLPRTELLLTLACAAAAAMLAASQFTDMFQLTPPGGEALAARTSEDQHGYAMLVLAVLALVLVIISSVADTRAREGLGLHRVAAFGVAASGVVALLLFLTIDLPDVNKIGTLEDERRSFVDAKAEPQLGFWLELVGSIVLAACGIALATMRASDESPSARASADRGPRGGTDVKGSQGPRDEGAPSQAARTRQVG